MDLFGSKLQNISIMLKSRSNLYFHYFWMSIFFFLLSYFSIGEESTEDHVIGPTVIASQVFNLNHSNSLSITFTFRFLISWGHLDFIPQNKNHKTWSMRYVIWNIQKQDNILKKLILIPLSNVFFSFSFFFLTN